MQCKGKYLYLHLYTYILALIFFSSFGCEEKLDIDLGNKPKPTERVALPPPTNLSWSLDGKWILFLAESTIKIMKTDEGRQVTALTGTGQYDNPVWSPKGDQIAYDLSSDFGLPEIWVKDAFKKSVPISVTADLFYDSNPTWSSDGMKIAFQSRRSGNWDIWIAKATRTSNLIQLTDNPKSDQKPVWSPDGRQIAFESDRSGTSGIWLASPNKDEPEKQFTFNSTRSYGIKWSPDSSKMAYFSVDSATTQIMVKSTDGSGNPRDIGALNAISYSWTPSGLFIVYESEGKILAKSIETNETPIHIADGISPIVSPDGSQIAFVQYDRSTNSFAIKIVDAPAAIR